MSHEWRLLLDSLESDLQDYGRVLAARGVAGPVPEWAPPLPQSPLPAELADRARRLLARQQELGTRLQEAMAELAHELAQQRTQGRAFANAPMAEPSTAYLDTTA